VIDEADTDNFDPALAYAGNGDLYATWTRSANSPGAYASTYAAYRHPGDAAGAMTDPVLVSPGTGVRLSSNFAIRTMMAPDPQVPNAVWQGRPYTIGGTYGFASEVSQLQTGGTSYVPINPVRVLDTRAGIGVGLSGAFSSSVPRSWKVGGFKVGNDIVIPANAVAVTGNFTVVGQSAAGYASITTTPNANPATSTLNFPVGDVRANNVTVPLSSTGTLSAVYKGSPGKTTHFLFDVTGYFLAGDTNATYATVAPVRVLDTRAGIGIGLTGKFSANTPRTLSIAGDHGIPADATAVTANVTVVGQTTGGYLSVTPTSTASPSTSTMNFPVADVRANGLTAPLNGSGDLSIVYKASGGTADVLLDITGYYREAPGGALYFPLDAGRLVDTRGVPLSRLNGKFLSGTTRTVSANGHFGIPSGATAVTANLVIVGQSSAGYAAITPNPDANPATSIINVPLADVRANGATVPLNASADLSLVFKGKAGATTHMILDVTGYFR